MKLSRGVSQLATLIVIGVLAIVGVGGYLKVKNDLAPIYTPSDTSPSIPLPAPTANSPAKPTTFTETPFATTAKEVAQSATIPSSEDDLPDSIPLPASEVITYPKPTVEFSAASTILTLQKPYTTISWSITGVKEAKCIATTPSETYSPTDFFDMDTYFLPLEGKFEDMPEPGTYTIRCLTRVADLMHPEYVSKTVTLTRDWPASATYILYVDKVASVTGQGSYETAEAKCVELISTRPNSDISCNWGGLEFGGAALLR